MQTPGVGVQLPRKPRVGNGFQRLGLILITISLYSVDGGANALFVVISILAGAEFEHTDHCGRIELLSDQLNVIMSLTKFAEQVFCVSSVE